MVRSEDGGGGVDRQIKREREEGKSSMIVCVCCMCVFV